MNLESKKTGTKFYFDEDNKKNGSITLRVATAEESMRIDKIVTSKVWKRKAGQSVEIVERDEKLSIKLLYDFCIISWENLQIDGQESECNKESKYKLMMNHPAFSSFVSKCIDELNEQIEDGGLGKN